MIKLVHVTKEIISECDMDAYVDDADLYATSEETEVDDNNPFAALQEDLIEEEEEIQEEQGENPRKTAKILEKNAQSWVLLVELTGGLIVFHKCWWHMISFAAIGGAMITRSSTQFNFDLTLTNSEGQNLRLKLSQQMSRTKDLDI